MRRLLIIPLATLALAACSGATGHQSVAADEEAAEEIARDVFLETGYVDRTCRNVSAAEPSCSGRPSRPSMRSSCGGPVRRACSMSPRRHAWSGARS